VAHQPTQPFDGGRTVRTGDFPHLALLGVNLLATAAITAAPAFFPHFSHACGWRRSFVIHCYAFALRRRPSVIGQ
jgi:hypothetical protein